jgi:hypothetical protein
MRIWGARVWHTVKKLCHAALNDNSQEYSPEANNSTRPSNMMELRPFYIAFFL